MSARPRAAFAAIAHAAVAGRTGLGAAVADAGRAVPVPGAGNHDLDAVRAGLQPAARLRRPAVVRARRVLRHRRLCVRTAAVAVVAQPLVRSDRRSRHRRRLRRSCGGVHLASARHLLRAADDRLRPGVLVRGDQMALGHRRRGRPAQHQAPARRFRLRARSTSRATRRSTTSRSVFSRWSSSRCGASSTRRSAAS